MMPLPPLIPHTHHINIRYPEWWMPTQCDSPYRDGVTAVSSRAAREPIGIIMAAGGGQASGDDQAFSRSPMLGNGGRRTSGIRRWLAQKQGQSLEVE